MIELFYGEDRVRAKKEIERILGLDYEVIEGQDLAPSDLPSIFKGQSLFLEERRILLQDVSANKAVFEKLVDYTDTPHKVIVFEMKVNKRTTAFKELAKKIKVREFAASKDPNLNLVFDVYNMAKKDGKKAVEMLEKIKHFEDPIMFVGLMATQAIRDYERKPGVKEKKALKELSRLDLKLKSSKLSEWTLIEAFLLQLSSW